MPDSVGSDQVSEREVVQRQLVAFLIANAAVFNAPYGVLSGRLQAGKRSYRSITFGKARTLDAEIRIYSPSWLLLRTNRDNTVFHSAGELLAHIARIYLPKGRSYGNT